MPAPFVPFGAWVASATLVFTTGGVATSNVLGIARKDLAAMQPVDFNNIAVQLRAWWTVNMKPLTANDCALTAILMRRLSEESDTGFDYPVVPYEGGSYQSTGLSNNVTLVTSLITERRGASYRGRSYFNGLPASVVNGKNYVAQDYREDLLQAWNALLASFADGELYDLCVLSRQSGNAPRIVGVATPVIAFRVRNRIDTQRRRMPKEAA